MNRAARRVGQIGVLAVIAAMVVEVVRRAPDGRAEDGPGPPGFRQEIGGLGEVETAFSGPVILNSEISETLADGSSRRLREWRLRGLDPVPDGEGMRLRDVVVTRFGPPAEGGGQPAAYSVRAPSCWVPRVAGSSVLRLDTSRIWRFEKPILRLPLSGQDLFLETEAGDLDPSAGRMTSNRPFRLASESFELESTGFMVAPGLQRVEFGGPGLPVRWSFQDEHGVTYSGASDAGGLMESTGTGGHSLWLPASDVSTIEMPPESGLPGTFSSHGLRLELFPAAQGWQPRSAVALGPCIWAGSRAADWLGSVFGGDTQLAWLDGGGLDAVDLEGPVQIFYRGKNAGWATVDGGAWFGVGEGELYLYRGVEAWQGDQIVRAERFFFRAPEDWRAGGRVMVRGSGSSAEHVIHTHNGLWVLEDDALLVDPARASWLAAPRIEHREKTGALRAEGSFRFSSVENGERWEARGSTLEIEELSSGQQIRVDDQVVLRQGGAVFRGDRLRHETGKRTALFGSPASAQIQADFGLLRAAALAFIQEDEYLIPEGEPLLWIPGAALGLEGGEIEVSATRMRYRQDLQEWDLRGKVRFRGALEGSADRATWSPQDGLRLRVSSGVVTLDGATADIRHFHLEAEEIDLDAERKLHLRRNASAKLEFGDGFVVTVEGDEGLLAPDGGWFEGKTSLAADQGRGGAERIEWSEAAPSRPREVRLLRKAWLEKAGARADGNAIHYQPEGSLLTVHSGPGNPAVIRLPDGRTASGDWLRLDLVSRLLSGSKGVLTPGSR